MAASIGLDEGKRIKLNPIPSARIPPATAKPNFNLRFADLNENSEKNDASSDEMPDTKDLLKSTHQKKRRGNTSSDNSFSDPELDAIMLTVDTAPGSRDNSATNSTACKSDPAFMCVERGTKRSRLPSPLAPQTPRKFAEKKARLDIRSDPQSEEALFLHTSSLSSHHPAAGDYCAINDDYADDDLFTFDDSMFNLLTTPSIEEALDASPETKTKPTQTNTAHTTDLDNASEEIAAQIAPTGIDTKRSEAKRDCMEDDWADMEDWIMNSGSVQIV